MSSTRYVSALDLFSVGIGPSSSHTVGPMRAARLFVQGILESCGLGPIARIEAVLYGSLAATGPGHGTPDAVVAGLLGLEPETCDPQAVQGLTERIERSGSLSLLNRHEIAFAPGDLR
ncbi:MAG: serine ammonia-lyase, partial [Frondihabitans sp.]|nr:serine ammonia-lyase [Frondihabitans sp.]